MMYAEKLVTAVKVNGKVLREDGDTVALPFGSEYSLLIKNKNTVRALVKVEIDGVDATEGIQLIVPANGSIDLERFIKEGNLDKGHRFKFIERTARIENHRGIGAEDGLIRVEFEFERQPTKVEAVTRYVDIVYRDTYRDTYRDWPYVPTPVPYTPYRGDIWCGSGVIGQATYGTSNAASTTTTGASLKSTRAMNSGEQQFLNQVNTNFKPMAYYAAPNDVGITVPGSISEQKFETGAWFLTDGQKHVMILKLLGQVGAKTVERAVTVKMKKECPTCGAGNKHGSKFCRECGTAIH